MSRLDSSVKMRLLLFLLFIVTCNGNIQVLIESNGSYIITVNNQPWFRSFRTAIYVDDRWYSTDNQSLPLVNVTTAQGTDSILGTWNETIFTYNLIRQSKPTPIIARIRQWTIISALTFYFETGDAPLTTGQKILSKDDVRTVFPSFLIERIDENDERGYFTIAGISSISRLRSVL